MSNDLQKCHRCGEPSNIFKMSFFNTEMICQKCWKLEEEHHLYKFAKEEELRQTKMGNYNFKGIGLPIDLYPRKKQQ